MTRRRSFWFQCATVVVFIFVAANLYSQVDTGTILGNVTDSSGAVISNAKVTLINMGTNSALSTGSGADGSYRFSPVRIGEYKLDVSAPGFETASQKNIEVNVGANVVANFQLKPGSTTEVVDVTSTPPALETQSSSVGQVVDHHEVDNLPLNGRNFTFLAQLSAGVNTPQADVRGNAATGAFSANGLRPAQNNYLLDGIDNNSDNVDFLNGTNFVVLPPIDAIQEFKVLTSDFSAEYGRSGAAVLNATVKSGTNALHGTLWEFFRNDKLDAADFFERQQNPNTGLFQTHKGKLRQNQFGLSAGGPVVIPKAFNGHDKLFFFADYEGFRRRQGMVFPTTVPTLAERSSGYTNLQDIIALSSGNPRKDALGRSIPVGTILDPATTRAVTLNQPDPVSGLLATSTGFVRDPFGTCPASTMVFTLAGCGLNMLPAGRLDPNAIKLLNLFPLPTATGIVNNFVNSPLLTEDRDSFDTRIDADITQKDQAFFRFSLGNDPQLIPGPFGGIADGGGFASGTQTALSEQGALAETHIFSPTLVNVARAGLTYLNTTRSSPASNDLSNIPAQFGIQGIPQITVNGLGNGGLPNFTFNNLGVLGTSTFLPSKEISATFQFTDDLTKIIGKHTIHTGIEYQDVNFTTLQPPRSRSEYDYNGSFVNIPGISGSGVGSAEFLLTPMAATVPNGVPFSGGASQVRFSNIAVIHDKKQYVGPYIQDDWKVTQKLTLNLGLRWDFFGLVGEKNGHQANFVPSGAPGGPVYILPDTPASHNLSSGFANSFMSLLAKDGIALAITNRFGDGLGNSQYTNFAPRFGFAYQVTPNLVARGGFGMFFNGFENRGFSPNEGLNYPFIFKFGFTPPNDRNPLVFNNSTNTGPCTTAGPGGSAIFETGFSCTSTDPLTVNAQGLTLQGIQFNYHTPYTMEGNFTLQYAITPSLTVQAGYVTTLARHLEVFPQDNNVPVILPASGNAQKSVPFQDFARQGNLTVTEGSSYYHGLQTKVEKRFSGGLSFLATYTYSKVRSDAIDLLNQGSVSGTNYRAAGIIGIKPDYSNAPFDIRNVVHLSGSYELPFGKGKHFMSSAEGVTNAIVGGWSFIWSSTLQGGQPVNIACPTTTAAGTTCNAFVIPGQDPYAGPHNATQFFNPAAFSQPCILDQNSNPLPNSPAGCVPFTGAAALGGHPTQLEGPGFHRLDLSTSKDFPIKERVHLQFRTEFFNIFNHPNFNAPGFGGSNIFAVPNSLNFFNTSAFGKIGSTRDAPYDPRQVQFALKLYY
jgi:hypothetical protein